MSASLSQIAERGGLTPHGRAAWSPCPCCGAAQRGRSDRRGPLSFRGETWRCHAAGCKAGGGPAALVAALRFHVIPPKGDPRWREVYAVLEEDAGTLPGRDRRPASPRPPARFVTARAAERPQTASEPGRTDDASDTYPPKDEVRVTWAACVRLDRGKPSEPALAWLEGRGLSPALLGHLDLVRTLPDANTWPRWLPPSALTVHRLVVGMYDAAGELRSLRFRAIREPARPAKALPAFGHSTRGLVMADPLAQALLRGARADEDGMPWDGRVLVAEGETDFWTLAGDPARMTKALTDRRTFAVFGIVAGSWSDAIAARIPDDAQVVVWTDLDPPGERYAETIRASLAHRCDVRRRRPVPPPSSPPGPSP